MDNLNKINIYNKLLPFLSIGFFVVLWQAISVMLGIESSRLPSPYDIYKEAINIFNTDIAGKSIWIHIYYSIRRVLSGYFLALVIGLPIGLYMGWNRTFDKVIKPIFELLRPIPPVAWIPLAILWLGIGEGPKVFICFIGAVVIFILNAYGGMRYTNQLLIDASKTFGANRRQQFLNVALPASLPAVFTGIQNALSMAWMCLLAAEMVAGREGVGFIILRGMDINRPSMIIVGMIIIGLIGMVLAILARGIERMMCPWRRELV
jgi:ABC-type nitrate/sulfonate/bicarbonate transport system permease component